MMQTPLNLYGLFKYAQQMYPNQWIISRGPAGRHRYQYRQFGERVRRLSAALRALGVQPGERIGTIAWNDYRHLEAYFAIPLMGNVIHTINLRLPTDHLRYVIHHAEDRVLLVDEGLLPLLRSIHDQLPLVRAIVVLGDHPDLTQSPIQPAYAYEDLIAQAAPNVSYDPDMREDAPLGICYTSATTGNPKGVMYSHRGLYLHTLGIGMANGIGLSDTDTVLPVVPMFHVNAWGLPYAAVAFGSHVVLPGSQPTPQDLVDLMKEEHVTLAAGVPTVWLGVAQILEKSPVPLALRMVLCGGSAAPPALIRTYEEDFHIPFTHAYGMTETTPLATVARIKGSLRDRPADEIARIKSSQGLLTLGLDMRLVRDGQDAPWDGETMGELWLRGPWVTDQYYNDERTPMSFEDGWLKTGDIATIDPEGYVRLVDRAKDVVKSGGEWISSVDLENALMAHPAVFEAAVVGVPHPKWDERPLAFVVTKPEKTVSKEELLAHLAQYYPRWWMPDDVLFLAEIPKTTVGKFLKRSLRDQYRGHLSSYQGD
jgi:fatty-acyl-CoA synthase